MLVEHARGEHPPLDVAAPIDARQPHVLSDRECHGPAAALDLLRELQAGRGAADDQHPALGELLRIAVGLRRELFDAGGHGLGQARHDRLVEGTGREHDGAAQPVAAIGRNPIAVAPVTIAHDAGDRGARQHRS
jgi:hypothetical protein